MNLTWEERTFVVIWLLNLLVAVVYLLLGILVISPARTEKERRQDLEVQHDNRRTYLLRFVVMVLCPVVGPLFFIFYYILFRLPLWLQPNLEDVVFSKERVKTQLRADEERERDIVPLEEAVFLNENKDLRMVMMNTLRGDFQNSLGAFVLALNSKDSEAAHYAASVLSSELNEFRSNAQKMYRAIAQESTEETEYELQLLDYMDKVLKQRVFTELEQKKLVEMMEAAAASLHSKDASQLTEKHYEDVCLRLLEQEDYGKAETWCLRLAEQYPDCLPAYTCRLKLYFSLKNREAFFATLAALKASDIVIDRETLELVRVFGQNGPWKGITSPHGL